MYNEYISVLVVLTGYRYNGESQCKCLGCGNQEQYVNCADIEIKPQGGFNNNGVTSHNHDLTSHPLNMTSGAIGFISPHDRLASLSRRFGSAGRCVIVALLLSCFFAIYFDYLLNILYHVYIVC